MSVLCGEIHLWLPAESLQDLTALWPLLWKSWNNERSKLSLASLKLLLCRIHMIWNGFRHRWGTCTLAGHHKWWVEKGSMGNIYNWVALGLVLFPLKGKRKQLQFAYTNKNHVWELQHDTRVVQRELSTFLLLWLCLLWQESNWTEDVFSNLKFSTKSIKV